MRLTGPRPNPNPAPPPAESNYSGPPAFPSTPTSSQLPYPHQSSPESGTTLLEPLPSARRDDGLTDAEGLRQQWRGTSPPIYPPQEQDIGYQYDNPYLPDRSHSPSVGPWDSASQRAVSHYPLPTPTNIPLGSDMQDSRHLRNKNSYSGGLSYIDEEGAYHKSEYARPASALELRSLVADAAEMGESGPAVKFDEYETSPHPYPPSQKSRNSSIEQDSNLYHWLLFPTGLDRLLALFGLHYGGGYPIEQAIERKRRGIGGQKWPVAAWGLAVAMTAVIIYELVANHQVMGTPIAIKRLLTPVSPPTTACSLASICGHGGFPSGTPDQSWRFVLPIFLHVGVIHLALNMIAQITAGAQVERELGTIPFLIVYFAGGIYGFVLGGNFSRTGIPSVGASGALFATNACVLVDLLLHWKYEARPKLKAFLLAIEFLVGIAIGYIPNAVDGLAHLGGFAMGLLLGSILYPSISETKRHRNIVWGIRFVALALAIVAFVLTVRNFYTADPNAACEWCRFLSCIPTSTNQRCTGTGITSSTTSNTRRSWELL
ncbi:hypothetical protein P7C73_g5833, partial [Tremellales sp. Uapishka_1]